MHGVPCDHHAERDRLRQGREDESANGLKGRYHTVSRVCGPHVGGGEAKRHCPLAPSTIVEVERVEPADIQTLRRSLIPDYEDRKLQRSPILNFFRTDGHSQCSVKVGLVGCLQLDLEEQAQASAILKNLDITVDPVVRRRQSIHPALGQGRLEHYAGLRLKLVLTGALDQGLIL